MNALQRMLVLVMALTLIQSKPKIGYQNVKGLFSLLFADFDGNGQWSPDEILCKIKDTDWNKNKAKAVKNNKISLTSKKSEFDFISVGGEPSAPENIGDLAECSIQANYIKVGNDDKILLIVDYTGGNDGICLDEDVDFTCSDTEFKCYITQIPHALVGRNTSLKGTGTKGVLVYTKKDGELDINGKDACPDLVTARRIML